MRSTTGGKGRFIYDVDGPGSAGRFPELTEYLVQKNAAVSKRRLDRKYKQKTSPISPVDPRRVHEMTRFIFP